jgi:DNA polymerase III subunit epsilon
MGNSFKIVLNILNYEPIMKQLKRLFIDVETTGTDHKIHAIHQISGIIEIDGIIKETFDFNIKPFEGAVIDEEALEIGGVSVETIMQYPEATVIYGKLMSIFTKYINKFDKTDKFVLIGYNVHFDKNFLSEFWLRNNDKYFFSLCWGSHIDIMSMAMLHLEKIRHELVDFKLMTVVKHFCIIIDEDKLHNSLYDIEISRTLFYKILNKSIQAEPTPQYSTDLLSSFMPNNSNTSIKANTQEVKKLNKISDTNYVMPFGKHKSQTIKYILKEDPQYIIWLSDNLIKGLTFSNEIMSEAVRKSNDKQNEPNDFDMYPDDLPFK